MNILALTDVVPYPPNTGIKIRTYNTLRQLSRRGHRVFLVSFNHRVLLPDEAAKERCRKALLEDFAEVHILEIPSERNRLAAGLLRVYSLFGRQPYRVYRYSSEECRALIRGILARVPIDLIHLDKTEFFPYAALAPGVPAVATNHNVESVLFRRRADHELTGPRRAFARIQARRTASYERRVLQQMPAFIACTPLDAETFRRDLGITSRSVVIDNGVDTGHYRPLDGPKGDYVLLIGAQSREATANYDATMWFFRDIWPAIRKGNPLLALRIVGRNPDQTVLELARQDSRVTVSGFVDDEREVLGRARLLLVPLRVGGGSRLKILTSMAMGTAVVSTTIGAEGIECRPGADIAIGDTPQAFAAHTLRLFDDEAARTELQRKARVLVESVYDWTVIGEKLEGLYRRLVQESGQPVRGGAPSGPATAGEGHAG